MLMMLRLKAQWNNELYSLWAKCVSKIQGKSLHRPNGICYGLTPFYIFAHHPNGIPHREPANGEHSDENKQHIVIVYAHGIGIHDKAPGAVAQRHQTILLLKPAQKQS